MWLKKKVSHEMIPFKTIYLSIQSIKDGHHRPLLLVRYWLVEGQDFLAGVK